MDSRTRFPFALLPDELVENVVAALVCHPTALQLRSDQLRAALGLALSCKRYYSMVMAEARHKLMPPHARPDEGLRLSKAQVKSAPVEQLRAWAQQAQIDRAAPKKRRSTPQPAPTVARLRQLVQAECCSTLPRWERRLFRAMAAEREEEVSPTEAHTKWRLSEVELIELRSGRPYAPLLLVDVVAKARQKFGGEAAFLDRKHKVRASKASLIKARTAEAQKELQRWRRREPMDWAEHAHAFRQYTHYGLMPNPRVITTQLVMARRKAAVVAELDSRGLDEKLVYTVSMRGYWDLSWWDAKRTGVGLQEAISRLMTTEAIKRTRIEQVAHVLESQRVPAEARQFVRANLMQYTEALWSWDPRVVGSGNRSNKSLAASVRALLDEWKRGKKAEAGGGESKPSQAAEAVRRRMAEAGWGMLQPMRGGQ